jgi:hypothetical protein
MEVEPTYGKSADMPEVIAGFEIPGTAAVAEATTFIQRTTTVQRILGSPWPS